MESLKKLLSHPSPGFLCRPAGNRDQEKSYMAPVAHLVNAPASLEFLDKIPPVPGAVLARRDFYAKCNGALLYTGRGSMGTGNNDPHSEGIEIFSIEEWPERTAETVESWGEHEDDEMPYGRNDFISIAHARGASNYIHWVTHGPARGKIYWWAWTMPPDKDAVPVAENFAGFVNLICANPVHFLNEISFCYTRYADGTSNTQWIPDKYLPDARPK